MRSKLLLALVCLGTVVFATVPTHFFNEHQSEILEGAIVEGDGYCYGVGRSRPITNSKISWKNAKQKAELLALDRLIRRMTIDNVTWPKALSPESISTLANAYMEKMAISATLSHIQTLYTERELDHMVAVVAVSKEEAKKLLPPTFTSIYEHLFTEEALFQGFLPIEVLSELYAMENPIPQAVNRSPWTNQLNQASFSTYRLRRLPDYVGRYPVGTLQVCTHPSYQLGMRAYQNSQLQEAYSHFLTAAEATLAYDALNMAGNVARRIGKLNEAVPLLLHAAYLKPASSHPWVHLAFVAEHLGSLDVMASCIAEAEMRNPDAWSREQIVILREKVQALTTVKSTDELPQVNDGIE